MIEFNSTKVVDSKAYPGVSFTIKAMTEGVRTRLMLALINELAEIRQIQSELELIELPQNEEGVVDEKAKIAPDIMAKVSNLTDKIQLIRKSKIDPIYGRTCFVSITGVKVDGKENPTIDDIRDLASEKLYQEIIQVIRAEVEMTEEEKQNLESPTTLGAQAVGEANGSTAPTVEPITSTSTATVESSQI